MKTANIEATVIDHCGNDLSVVNAARVSFHKESKWEINGQHSKVLAQGDIKLINYLAKHKHFSPFNHAFLTARVKAPIFVARQLVKHKFMPWNEVSRRYVDEEPEFYFPEFWRGRPVNSKQGSDGVVAAQLIDSLHVNQPIEDCLQTYQDLLNRGVAPEQARMILPQNTMTEWIWSGTLGAFADMLHLRLDPHTQAESRIVAQQLHEQILKLFPVSLAALLENK
jgi:thymidylate synthase (FAD)